MWRENIWGIRSVTSVFVQSAKEMARVNTQAVPTAIQKRNLSLYSVVVMLFQRIVRRLQNIDMGAKRRLSGIQKGTPRKQQTVSCSYLCCTSGITVGLTRVPIVTKGRAEVESIR